MPRLRLIVSLVAAAACSANPHREPTVVDSTDSTGGVTKDLATRYEHGDGVPRDYTRAIQIHEERCAGGQGDPVACRKLVVHHVKRRGELKQSRVDPLGLLGRACRAGDWLSCGPYAQFDVDAAQAACDGDQPAACLAVNSTHFMSQSGTLEFEDGERRERACHGGVLEACLEIVEIASYSHEDDDEVAWEGEGAPAEALAVVTRECDQGDADACKVLLKPIDPAELCDANDFEACTRVGASNPAALAKACDHGVPEACEGIALAARDADPPDPRVPQHFERACKLGSDAACRQNSPVDLAIGCAAYLPARVPGAKRRSLPPLSGTVAGSAWSAPAGQPFIVLSYDEHHGTPAFHGEVARHLGDDVAVYVLVDDEAVAAEFAPAIAVVLDPTLADEPLTTEKSVMSGLTRDLSTGWTIVDAGGTPRAILYTEWGFQPVTLARCARGILSEG